MALPEIGSSTWEAEVIQASSAAPVLVDFWATWCGPCKLIGPVCEALQKDYGAKLKVVKLELDPSKDIGERYKVYGLPTLILFAGGVEKARREGAMTKASVGKWLGDNGVTA